MLLFQVITSAKIVILKSTSANSITKIQKKVRVEEKPLQKFRVLIQIY